MERSELTPYSFKRSKIKLSYVLLLMLGHHNNFEVIIISFILIRRKMRSRLISGLTLTTSQVREMLGWEPDLKMISLSRDNFSVLQIGVLDKR